MNSIAPRTTSTPITEWLFRQARLGLGPQQALASMQSAGWAENEARRVIAQTFEKVVPSYEIKLLDLAAQRLPGPDITQQPLYIELSDRKVSVLHTAQKPNLVVFGELLSPQECAALVAEAMPRMTRSTVMGNKEQGSRFISPIRTSANMFFRRAETELIRALEERISKLLNWPVDCGEGMQVARYQVGHEYKAHVDHFRHDAVDTQEALKRGGQRVGTLVIYLTEPTRGGGTSFPKAGLRISPKLGQGLFFSYRPPEPDQMSLHSGDPVLEGEKWIATKWLREKPAHF